MRKQSNIRSVEVAMRSRRIAEFGSMQILIFSDPLAAEKNADPNPVNSRFRRLRPSWNHRFVGVVLGEVFRFDIASPKPHHDWLGRRSAGKLSKSKHPLDAIAHQPGQFQKLADLTVEQISSWFVAAISNREFEPKPISNLAFGPWRKISSTRRFLVDPVLDNCPRVILRMAAVGLVSQSRISIVLRSRFCNRFATTYL